jgi:hypothetical protein
MNSQITWISSWAKALNHDFTPLAKEIETFLRSENDLKELTSGKKVQVACCLSSLDCFVRSGGAQRHHYALDDIVFQYIWGNDLTPAPGCNELGTIEFEFDFRDDITFAAEILSQCTN